MINEITLKNDIDLNKEDINFSDLLSKTLNIFSEDLNNNNSEKANIMFKNLKEDQAFEMLKNSSKTYFYNDNLRNEVFSFSDFIVSINNLDPLTLTLSKSFQFAWVYNKNFNKNLEK